MFYLICVFTFSLENETVCDLLDEKDAEIAKLASDAQEREVHVSSIIRVVHLEVFDVGFIPVYLGVCTVI